jgi:hypothetical protein
MHLGNPEPSDKFPVSVRSVSQHRVNGFIEGFLSGIGYEFLFQYRKKGVVFVVDDLVSVTVSQLVTDLTDQQQQEGEAPYFVEVHSRLVEVGQIQVMSERVLGLASYLKG